MGGKLAARVTSRTEHAAADAKPGLGSFNVEIGGKPAWRAEIDEHDCPEHGPEKVTNGGSDKVLINNYRAVRMDDFLESSAGPPNLITWGNWVRVEIGATEVGITTPEAIDEFCTEICALEKDWPCLTPDERQARYTEAVGKQYDRMGVPRPAYEFFNEASKPGIGAYWSPSKWAMGLPESLFTQPEPSKWHLEDGTYHEIRHTQQTYYSMRSAAGRIQRGELDPADPDSAWDLSWTTGVKLEIARRAMQNPLDRSSPEGRYGATQESATIRTAGLARHGDICDAIWDASKRAAAAKAKGDKAAEQQAQQDFSKAVSDYAKMPGGSDAKHAEGALRQGCTCPP